MARRYFSSTAAVTALSSGVNTSATTLVVDSVAGWPASTPFTIALDRGTASEELAEVTAVVGTTLTVTRGIDGSSAKAHTAGATVEHCVSARDFDEGNAHTSGTSQSHTNLAVQPASTAGKGLVVKALTGQTGNLCEWQDDTGAALGYIDSVGRLGQDPGLVVTGTPIGGAAGALPANPQGYIAINVGGDVKRVPFYG